MYVPYENRPSIGQILFNNNKVLSAVSRTNDELPVYDCKDIFSNFVYKPHGHVHTGNLDSIDNIQLCSIMKRGQNSGKPHHAMNIS